MFVYNPIEITSDFTQTRGLHQLVPQHAAPSGHAAFGRSFVRLAGAPKVPPNCGALGYFDQKWKNIVMYLGLKIRDPRIKYQENLAKYTMKSDLMVYLTRF